jgi:phosphoribosylanthranilate isomerase
MINGIRLKVCGITSLVDADAADAVGADYLGFIFHAGSPRNLSATQYTAMKDRLPPRQRVAVCVQPSLVELAALERLGFDCFQVHFSADTPGLTLAQWAQVTGRKRLWLAPKLPPGLDVKAEWLKQSDTFLLDTFHADKFGGTGETGDWAKFKRHRETENDKAWILSGGLNSDNIAAAIAATYARFVDVNSGVEQSPGIKSPAKLQAFALALHNATKHQNPAYRP